jgi:DNA mismatch endonuclease, patch repair protein
MKVSAAQIPLRKRVTTTPDPLRSSTMRAVKSKDTRPELAVRSLLHRLGYRFRIHRKDLPGNPDIVFPSRHKVIFVHGCFWHGHNCIRGARTPVSNRNYWIAKILRNVTRDEKHLRDLESSGWHVLVLWECELKNANLQTHLENFLSPSSATQ